MGFFDLLKGKRHKNKAAEETEPYKADYKKASKRPVRPDTPAERLDYIKDNCETIAESIRLVEEAKVEYQAVTSYLTDMQKIDLIPAEQRESIEEAAKKIISLTKERSKLQNKSSILPDKQYQLFEQYEQQLPKDMKSIKESEDYQVKIQKDMEHLEDERQYLLDEQEDIVNKQAFLKGIAIAISITIIFLFAIFALLSSSTEANYTIPFILTVCLGVAAACYIFLEARKNDSGNRLVQAKQNRQIMLMNKVIIKSVNNRNYLDYTYSKYMIENYEQLKILWEEYLRVKEEAQRYQNNTDLLEFYNNELIHELKKYGISDSEIWIYQPSAILDSKEMVEVRHRLNVRRQKLRERIDAHTKQREDALNAVKKTMQNYPDCGEEAGRLLRRYRIEIEE